MPNFSFNHMALAVKDVQKSISFYQNVFQLEEIENTASHCTTRWLSLGEGKQLHLISRPEAQIQTIKAVHFALATNDVHSFIKHLQTLKIDYSDWPGSINKDYVRNDGIQQVYFQDPDGYWIEVNNDV
ncbi:glyoxalase [Nonlabens sp. YIK11]|nr:glyoxalase [Nonlabens sp. YIK11]